jgi:septum formation protein
MTSIILASASAARARLLREAGVAFGVRPANVDEEELKASLLGEGAKPDEIAAALAELKAARVSAAAPGAVVIGCDQVLVLDGELIGKSADVGEARTLLQRLRGKTHSLVTACALARGGTMIWRRQDRAMLHMRPFSDVLLDAYLKQEGSAILGSVGCYHLEGGGAQLFDRVDGDYFSVLGLPLIPLLGALRENGMLPT